MHNPVVTVIHITHPEGLCNATNTPDFIKELMDCDVVVVGSRIYNPWEINVAQYPGEPELSDNVLLYLGDVSESEDGRNLGEDCDWVVSFDDAKKFIYDEKHNSWVFDPDMDDRGGHIRLFKNSSGDTSKAKWL